MLATGKGIYIIRWYRKGTVVAELRCDDLIGAKQTARERFPVHRSRKGATSAVVSDDDSVVYLQLP